MLAVRGRMLPSTLENLTLCAEILYRDHDGGKQWRIIEGESNLPNIGGQIKRVFLKPDVAQAKLVTWNDHYY